MQQAFLLSWETLSVASVDLIPAFLAAASAFFFSDAAFFAASVSAFF